MHAEPNHDLLPKGHDWVLQVNVLWYPETIVHSARVAGHPPNGQNSDVKNTPILLMKT